MPELGLCKFQRSFLRIRQGAIRVTESMPIDSLQTMNETQLEKAAGSDVALAILVRLDAPISRRAATRTGRGSAQACRSGSRPHCPGPACPLLSGFRSWRCRYAAIEMYSSAKHIQG